MQKKYDGKTSYLPWNLPGDCFAKPRNDTVGVFILERSVFRGGFTRNDKIGMARSDKTAAAMGLLATLVPTARGL